MSLPENYFSRKTNRQQRLAGRLGRQGTQRARRLQCPVIEQAETAAFLNPSADDLAFTVENDQDQDVAFKALGNGFGGVENSLLLLLQELALNFLCP